LDTIFGYVGTTRTNYLVRLDRTVVSVTPFLYEEPLPAREPLVDRETELEGLSARALAGRNTRLEAPRRYGKTSVLKHMLAQLDNAEGVGVYVDLYGVVSGSEVVARLERAMRSARLPRGHGRWLPPSAWLAASQPGHRGAPSPGR
jgi:hypothetical protein